MRELLAVSVATLSLMGAALAQQPIGAPTQGQQAWPMANPTASANNNNNYQAPALPGPSANPTPGTIVIHGNGRVQAQFGYEAH
jgi:hypothetical protein